MSLFLRADGVWHSLQVFDGTKAVTHCGERYPDGDIRATDHLETLDLDLSDLCVHCGLSEHCEVHT